MRADDVVISSGGTVSSSTLGEGLAGSVIVTARRLLASGDGFAGFTGISSSAGSRSAGDAGQVRVRADDAEVRSGGTITSTTFGEASAGSVEIAAGRLLVSGDGFAGFTGIASQASSTSSGNAGSIAIDAEALEIRDGATVSSAAFADGSAGDVTLRAGALLIDGASVSTRGADSAGGRIGISASDLVLLRRAEVISDGIVPASESSIIPYGSPPSRSSTAAA